MLWDSSSVSKDGNEESSDAPITPILVPLQSNAPTSAEKVPLLVPDVQDLKDQFQKQQNMLTQIKETLKKNETQLSSKGKQVEIYANKLSQIRARSKNTQGKKPGITSGSPPKSLTKKSSKENFSKLETAAEGKDSGIVKIGRKGKVSELKKCLEENKIKFEQRSGKEQFETKKIESLVEQLKMQVEERDKTIQDLQKNIEQPKLEPSQKKTKQKFTKDIVASKFTQTAQLQPFENSIEVIALQNKIYELEANVLDLEENLKEKESVIEARTQAVTLLSQDLSLKGKNTLESLEETRQEMRTMQNNFILIEDQLKKDLLDRENRLNILEEKCKKLESTNFELSLKNAEQQEKVVNLQVKYLELEKEKESSRDEDELRKKINVLTKEVDERNKAMIKMKIEHKNKIKALNKTLETLKNTSDDKAEIARLNNLLDEFENIKIGLETRLAELEDEKGNLLLSVLDVDDFKVCEKKLKDQINELEITINKQNEELIYHRKTVSELELENKNLSKLKEDQSSLIESLRAKVEILEKSEFHPDSEAKEFKKKLENLEEEYKRKIEYLKAEHGKEMEMLESYYTSKVENVDKRELEEYRISTEISNIHVEEQIELLVREKQQLLEKLKSLSGVSSTDSLTFEKMEHSDLKDDKYSFPLGEEVEATADNRTSHLQRIINDQQLQIASLQNVMEEEKQKTLSYQKRITELNEVVKSLESVNATYKQEIEIIEAGENGKSQKSSANIKNKLKKVELELIQAKKTIQEQQDKVSDLGNKLQEKEELIKNYTERIELFEKDDWDRQNHWKNAEDEIENLQELQKKCLSLENSLIELNEDCERLRKENIEVVHLLSEEKVKRRKLLEELQAKPDAGIEERLQILFTTIQDLEEKVEKIEVSQGREEKDELLGKLEWSNVVITGKDTEIFRLQNLLEDRDKAIEIMNGNLSEYKSKLENSEKKLKEMTEQLKAKEVQLEEISVNFNKLQECVDVANQKTSTNEAQLKELLATVKEMEGDVFRKESELQEIKGILAEKNLDMTNLRNRLEEVNSDLTYSYQEHLENMGKCLRDKESDYGALLTEKNHIEEIYKKLVAEKEDIYNQKVEIFTERNKLQEELNAKEKIIAEITEKLNKVDISESKPQEVNELKLKLKKLAANLKKKVQNEADLHARVKELENNIAEKDKLLGSLKKDLSEVTEKWMSDTSEKELIKNDLSTVVVANSALENEKFELKEKVMILEKQLEEFRQTHDSQVSEMAKKIQKLSQSSETVQNLDQQYKGKVEDLENKLAEEKQLFQKADAVAKANQQEMETLLQQLALLSGKFEETKFNYEQLHLEKDSLEKKLEDASKLSSEYSHLDAKIQENMAVIESLESELEKTKDQLKTVEEKFFFSEERRMSLENKNEEMCRKIMEDSQTLVTIDDLWSRVDELLKSEKLLQDSVKALEGKNSELKISVDELQTEKFNLESNLKSSAEKLIEINNELIQVKETEAEKNFTIRDLTKEVEKLKADNKQMSSEFEKLNKDYEQFENDFKENLESSRTVEKTLKHKLEELTMENASLTEKFNAMTEEKNQKKLEEDKKPKKRKSVTFRTDEVEYIKELKNQLHNYDTSLKQANEEIESLKAELFREKLRQEVLDVVVEAKEKVESLRSSPEKKKESVEPEVVKVESKEFEGALEERKFDAAVFFGDAEASTFFDKPKVEESESLTWDDDWGTAENLKENYISEKLNEINEKSKNQELLESEIAKLREDNEKLSKECQEQLLKYTKAIKKLKELKAVNEKMQTEIKKMKSNTGFEDLDAAIVDELRSQIEAMERKEKELHKNLESSKAEKESLLKRIEKLNEGNEKYLEIKERQNNEVEIWQRKNDELLQEISELRRQMKEPLIPNDNALIQENRKLRNTIEVLEWKNCELSELLEEKQEQLEVCSEKPSADVEKVIKEKSLLQKEIDELNNVKLSLEKKLFDEEKKNSATIGELNEQLTALASENETLQDILGKIKTDKKEESKIFDYFKSTPSQEDSFFVASNNQNESQALIAKNNEQEKIISLKDLEVNNIKSKLNESEGLLKMKEEELNVMKNKMESEMNALRAKITETEAALRLRDEEFHQLRNLNLEKESEAMGLRQRAFEFENQIGIKEEELKRLRVELKALQMQQTQFEIIDLNKSNSRSEELDILRQKVLELEGLLNAREEELQMVVQNKDKEAENLRSKIFQLEDMIKFKEDELSRLQTVQWKDANEQEVQEMRNKMMEMEEFIRFKENEFFQFQSLKANEIQALQHQLYESQQNRDENILENQVSELKYQEEEYKRLLTEKSNEIDSQKQQLLTLENTLITKEEEIKQLLIKLNELEKSYNDSKLEIERLLNEEKLNTEEKFVEPFQKNIQIPMPFELEAMSRTLDEEKQKSENLKYELSEKDNLLHNKNEEIQILTARIHDLGNRAKECEENNPQQVRFQLEKIISQLQDDLENSNLQLKVTRKELEEFQNLKDEAMDGLKTQLFKLESEHFELMEKYKNEVLELNQKAVNYSAKIEEDEKKIKEIEIVKCGLEKEIKMLKAELESKDDDVTTIGKVVEEERNKVKDLMVALEEKEKEVGDLRQTLLHLQEEITEFRNFEKQVKELRVAQIQEGGSEIVVTPEGHPDLSNWTEHELAELSTRLQSDLDTALYMLHQRDVRCDELTFELMQLLEERDTLQLRLSTALRINEELRSISKVGKISSGDSLEENKDLEDQSNDRQKKRSRIQSEDLRQLASKISELHSVNYLRDKTVKDDSVQRHNEQMNLLSRVSDSDITLSRDVQSSPAVLLNWVRGKTIPKVMHI